MQGARNDTKTSFKVRPRALLFALGFLLLLDLALRLPLPLPLPRDFRLPNRTSMGYEQLVAKMQRDPNARIAVVGDSIVWGGNAESWDTLSAKLGDLYRTQGRAVSAYNLGFNGGHANDLLPVIAELSTKHAADVILLNLDMRFYGERTVARRYPELYAQAAGSLGSVPKDLMAIAATPTAPVDAEKKASKAVERVWRLYALRDYLAAAIFGEAPASALNRFMNRTRANLFGPPLYGKKAPSKLPLSDLKKAFALQPLTADNINVRYLTAALDIARAHGVPVIVFGGPVDSALLDQLKAWNRADYESNLSRMRIIVESHGARFQEYTDAVPGELIADSHHPLAAGYEALAKAMLPDLEPLVKAALTRREQARDRAGSAQDGSDGTGGSNAATSSEGADR